jgi:hypothetical protein
MVARRTPDETANVNRLRHNLTAIVLNGLFFPGAGRVLEAGRLLAWSDISDRAWLVGTTVPIQYGVALVAQPWVGEYLATTRRRSPWYLGQAVTRGMLCWGFFGVGNIAFSDMWARAIPEKRRGRTRGWRGAAVHALPYARDNRFVIRAATPAAAVPAALAFTLSLTGGGMSAPLLLAAFISMVFIARLAQVGLDLATKNYVAIALGSRLTPPPHRGAHRG